VECELSSRPKIILTQREKSTRLLLGNSSKYVTAIARKRPICYCTHVHKSDYFSACFPWGKNVQATIEEFLDVSFFTQYLSYQTKACNQFFSELFFSSYSHLFSVLLKTLIISIISVLMSAFDHACLPPSHVLVNCKRNRIVII
jgi:hypothetical protein